MGSPIRVFIADDHVIFRDGLRRILEASGLSLIGETGLLDEVVPGVLAGRAEVLLLDVALPGGGGREVLRRLRAQHCETGVVVLSTHEEDTYAAWLVRSGAKAYLTKGRSASELLDAIHAAAAGATYLTEPLAKLLEGDAMPDDAAPHTRLSPREHEVFRLLVRGRTPTRVAHELNLSSNAVSTLIGRIRAELGVDSVPALLVYACRHGLL